MNAKGLFDGALGMLAVVAIIFAGIFMVAVGWTGIEEHFGWWWGVGAVVIGVLFRFTLPLVVGVYFCARDVWDWGVLSSLLLVAALSFPMVIFMLPGLVAELFRAMRPK